MNHEQKARELFHSGYNCAQAVVLAFSDVTGLDEKTATLLSSSFGGGMGRLREVCGAVSGAFMVAGLLFGYSDTTDHEAKKEHYALIQRIAREFKEQNGSYICRELLDLPHGPSDPEPEKRTEAYYHRRSCEDYVAIAARVLDGMLSAEER
ncbi:MAG: C_GCAxxG_C_C family protein [Ruminococcaceae bacterium]|nr:C_GCAxxG_C_C family protein [Oscillospiraceae bacterium]